MTAVWLFWGLDLFFFGEDRLATLLCRQRSDMNETANSSLHA